MSLRWQLRHVSIENFKSIKKGSVDILPGFTVINGANGSGKSCLLESIGFALGAPVSLIRAQELAELVPRAESSPELTMKVSVSLDFVSGLDGRERSSTPEKDSRVTVCSMVAEGQRAYIINGSKVTKLRFSQFITETLGFPKEFVSWNIGQRAVQDILRSSPKQLFDALCFVAGTFSVLEARTSARQQIEKSRRQLEEVSAVIHRLEAEIRRDSESLDLLEEHRKLSCHITELLVKQQLAEQVHENARQYFALCSATDGVAALQTLQLQALQLLTHNTCSSFSNTNGGISISSVENGDVKVASVTSQQVNSADINELFKDLEENDLDMHQGIQGINGLNLSISSIQSFASDDGKEDQAISEANSSFDAISHTDTSPNHQTNLDRRNGNFLWSYATSAALATLRDRFEASAATALQDVSTTRESLKSVEETRTKTAARRSDLERHVSTAQEKLQLLQEEKGRKEVDRHQLVGKIIPQLCVRITTMQQKIEDLAVAFAADGDSRRNRSNASVDSSSITVISTSERQEWEHNDDDAHAIEQAVTLKVTQLRNAADVVRHSESLVMALTAAASQEISKERRLESTIRDQQLRRDEINVRQERLEANFLGRKQFCVATAVKDTTKESCGRSVEEDVTVVDSGSFDYAFDTKMVASSGYQMVPLERSSREAVVENVEITTAQLRQQIDQTSQRLRQHLQTLDHVRRAMHLPQQCFPQDAHSEAWELLRKLDEDEDEDEDEHEDEDKGDDDSDVTESLHQQCRHVKETEGRGYGGGGITRTAQQQANSGAVEGDLGYLADLLHIDLNRAAIADECTAEDILSKSVMSAGCNVEVIGSAATSSQNLILALNSILASQLGVRICTSSKAAANIMRIAQREGIRGLRIWPLDCLSVDTRRSQSFLDVIQRFPGILDPVQFVSIRLPEDRSDTKTRPPPTAAAPGSYSADIPSLKIGKISPRISTTSLSYSLPPSSSSTVSAHRPTDTTDVRASSRPELLKALYKALGTWVIAENDEVAGDVIASSFGKYGAVGGCVTLQGNKHTIGSLAVPDTDFNADPRENNSYTRDRDRNRYKMSPARLPLDYLDEYHTTRRLIAESVKELTMLRCQLSHAITASRADNARRLLQSELREVTAQHAAALKALELQKMKTSSAEADLEQGRVRLREAERERDHLREELIELQHAAESGAQTRDRLAQVRELSLRHDRMRLQVLINQREQCEHQAMDLATALLELDEEISQLTALTESSGSAIRKFREQEERFRRNVDDLRAQLQRREEEHSCWENKLRRCQEAYEAYESDRTALYDNVLSNHQKQAAAIQKLREQLAEARLHVLVSDVPFISPKDISSIQQLTATQDAVAQGNLIAEAVSAAKAAALASMLHLIGPDKVDSVSHRPEVYVTETRAEVAQLREEVEAMRLKEKQVRERISRTSLIVSESDVCDEGEQRAGRGRVGRIEGDRSAMGHRVTRVRSRGAGAKFTNQKNNRLASDEGHEVEGRLSEMNDCEEEEEDGEEVVEEEEDDEEEDGCFDPQRRRRNHTQRQMQIQRQCEDDLRGMVLRKSSFLQTLKERLGQIELSIKVLLDGTCTVDAAVARLNLRTYNALRLRCRRFFSDLVPGKDMDLIAIGEEGEGEGEAGETGEKAKMISCGRTENTAAREVQQGLRLEKGLKFVLLESASDERTIPSESTGKENLHSKYQKSTSELSGGQMALLGLAFVFACATHRRSPLYLLDEVDAALDEGNQRTVAAVIQRMFSSADETAAGVGGQLHQYGSQVLCVSHHAGFQQLASNTIAVTMRDGHSIILK